MGELPHCQFCGCTTINPSAEAERADMWREAALGNANPLLDRLRALLTRAHDAMSRRDPDGISTEAWDQLLADMAKELGVGNG